MRRIRTTSVRASFLLILSCLFGSCTELFQDEMTNAPCEVGFYAGGVETRTEMLSDGLSAMWTPEDEIAVWARSSSGSFVLSNQKFTTYGINEGLGYFTTTLVSEMPSDTYTYFCCYPVPTSVSGTTATFSIPAVQDGKVSGGADIMIADPVSGSKLNSINSDEPHNDLSMVMNRMLHQFRFWLPKEYDTIGEKITAIRLTGPQNMAGTVSADISNPSAPMTLSDGVNSIYIDLAEPISSSESLDGAQFACVSIFPYEGTFTDSDYLNIEVYTEKHTLDVAPISLAGRKLVAGHSTPVRIIPVGNQEYYRLTLEVGDNYIGEPLTNVSIRLDGTNDYYGFNVTGESKDNFTNSVEAYGTDGKAAYDYIISSINAGTATYVYETEHALVTRPITSDMMKYDGNGIVLDLGDVPYLLYEDFSSAKSYAKNNVYAGSMNQESGNDGYLLDGYMSDAGWNASRFELIEGDCVNINCRLEGWGSASARYCGRFDTPALKWIKPDTKAEIILEYDRAFYVPVGFNIDDSSNSHARYKIGYHTKSETSAIDGVNSNSVNNAATIVKTSGLFASENVGAMTHESLPISSVTNQTRIVFFVDTDRTEADKTYFFGYNSCYYLYLDNIKIYFAD